MWTGQLTARSTNNHRFQINVLASQSSVSLGLRAAGFGFPEPSAPARPSESSSQVPGSEHVGVQRSERSDRVHFTKSSRDANNPTMGPWRPLLQHDLLSKVLCFTQDSPGTGAIATGGVVCAGWLLTQRQIGSRCRGEVPQPSWHAQGEMPS